MHDAANIPVVCVQGPTASGKSELAELICERFDGEVVSADSMQVYKGMDIGTAKVPVAERRVAYHCIDMIEPGKPFSASLFQTSARNAIEDIKSRSKMAVLCGGTGLYVRAVLDKMEFAAGEQENNDVRDTYTRYAEEHGNEALHDLLALKDPQSAKLIHPNNVRRVVRAFEMLEQGDSYARRKNAFKTVEHFYQAVKIGLKVDPTILNRRIDARVDKMFDDGLVEEVERLLEKGFREGLTAPQAIGYKEVVSYLDGTCSLEEAAMSIKQATRRYAKRQRTWLRSDSEIVWLDADSGIEEGLLDAACMLVSSRLDGQVQSA